MIIISLTKLKFILLFFFFFLQIYVFMKDLFCFKFVESKAIRLSLQDKQKWTFFSTTFLQHLLKLVSKDLQVHSEQKSLLKFSKKNKTEPQKKKKKPVDMTLFNNLSLKSSKLISRKIYLSKFWFSHCAHMLLSKNASLFTVIVIYFSELEKK